MRLREATMINPWHIALASLMFLAPPIANAEDAADSFGIACSPRANSHTQPPSGFGACYQVYADRAWAQLSRAPGGDTSALRIEYELPATHQRQNWLSIRREFPIPVDLSQASGLFLTYSIGVPSQARLRLTLSDHVDGQGSDMWWYDFEEDVLAWPASRSLSLPYLALIPFFAFKPCHGDGCRQNDGRLDLSTITAYEINILSEPGQTETGQVVIHSLTTLGAE